MRTGHWFPIKLFNCDGTGQQMRCNVEEGTIKTRSVKHPPPCTYKSLEVDIRSNCERNYPYNEWHSVEAIQALNPQVVFTECGIKKPVQVLEEKTGAVTLLDSIGDKFEVPINHKDLSIEVPPYYRLGAV